MLYYTKINIEALARLTEIFSVVSAFIMAIVLILVGLILVPVPKGFQLREKWQRTAVRITGIFAIISGMFILILMFFSSN